MNILITGGSGLVGSAVKEISKNYNYNFIFLSSKDGDLRYYQDTYDIFSKYNPDYVIHLAANVGGLYKNLKYRVEMLEDNIDINMNVLKCSHKFNVRKCISLLSTCIFPDKVEYPINEDMLHLGEPHNSNYPYAYAKRLLEIQSRVYREQYNSNFICLIPTNIYGPYDNYHLENSHVIPGLIHKCYLSKLHNKKFIIKGSGRPLRQFLYSIDLANIIMLSLESNKNIQNLIVSPTEETSIKDISTLIYQHINNKNELEFDKNSSDGQYKKTVDNTLLKSLFPDFKFTNINIGISKSIEWFLNNYNNIKK
jgi:GDP-L-fucose synthase